MPAILFTLNSCNKCNYAREELQNAGFDFQEVELSPLQKQWTPTQWHLVTEYDVQEKLERTAPILALSEDEHYVGFLSIRNYVKRNKN